MTELSVGARPGGVEVASSGERGDPVLQMATGFWAPRCLHVVAELGVADHLDEAPKTAADLATAVGADADALNRVLRLLASHGIFEERAGGYAHNAASRSLREDHPQSRRAYVRYSGTRVNWAMWSAFEKCVRTGKPAVSSPGGAFARLGEDPAASQLFDQAMTAKAHGDVAAILPAYDFSTSKTIVDVGGGRGHLVGAILDKVRSARGAVFDLPHVVANATNGNRLDFVAGDFFTDNLPAADTYLLMNVLHDWPDDKSATILQSIRRAARAGAKLLVIEAVIPQGPAPHWSKTLDINMLRIGGRERTEAEYAALLKAAGFRVTRVVPTQSPYTIIEAV